MSPSTPTTRTLRRVKWLVTAMAALLLLAATCGYLWTRTPMWRNRPIRFESARWKSTPSEFSHQSIRQRMVDDLLRTHPLVGLSRAKVEALIGPPDTTEYFRSHDMVYALGQERSWMLPIDSEWLIIKLDGSGNVIEAKLVTD